MTDATPSGITTALSSEVIDQIAPALAKAQGDLRSALKDSSNPFFKSKYADMASVLDATRPAFAAQGISILQPLYDAGENRIGVRTIFLHSSGQWVASTFSLDLKANANAQDAGTAITYARRYALQAFAAIASEDDDGNAASGRQTPPPPAAAPPQRLAAAPAQWKPDDFLAAAAAALEWVGDDAFRGALELYNVKNPGEITDEKRDSFIKYCRKLPKKVR